MQLSVAVGDVRITRPAVDYDRYLCREADSHSEGLCCFLTIAGGVLVYGIAYTGWAKKVGPQTRDHISVRS